MNFVHTQWSEKYRPKKVDDCILPDSTLKMAREVIKSGHMQNFMFTGSAGTGKTTLARALCEELDVEYILINGSNEGRFMDTLRNKIAQFASSVSFEGKKKVVIIDEADYLPSDTVQPALRGFIEEFGAVTSFILTCNYPNRILDPIHSRCSKIDFTIGVEEKKNLIPKMFNRIMDILNMENVPFDKKVVFQLIVKYFPDNRKLLNELQRYSRSGSIDSGILVNTAEAEIDKLISFLKSKQFTEMRNWVASTPNLDMTSLNRALYNRAYDICKKDSIPQMILDMADFDYKNAFVADKEINMVALLTTLMMNVEWQ